MAFRCSFSPSIRLAFIHRGLIIIRYSRMRLVGIKGLSPLAYSYLVSRLTSTHLQLTSYLANPRLYSSAQPLVFTSGLIASGSFSCCSVQTATTFLDTGLKPLPLADLTCGYQSGYQSGVTMLPYPPSRIKHASVRRYPYKCGNSAISPK